MDRARTAAFEILLKLQKDGAYSNLALEGSAALKAMPPRERAFAVSLVYGVTERLLTLDYNLSLYLKKPLRKLQPEALCLLRLGACQILFFDKIPPSAAVNETVQIARRRCAYASGLVNAVLRKIAAAGLHLPREDDPAFRNVKYSCPQWLIDRWDAQYGRENTDGILETSLLPAPVTARVNPLKTTPQALRDALENEGVTVSDGPAPELLTLEKLPCAVDALQSFRDGWFHVQDTASFLCAKALAAKPGDTVFDLCAAPGGKTFGIAEEMEDRGTVRAFDLYESRVNLISDGAVRLGLESVTAAVHDATQPLSFGEADRVLCDVPCSGLGVIRRKPEINYKSEESLAALPALQLSILKNGAACVKSGGRLVYSTCALSKDENEDVCAAFLSGTDAFVPVPPLPERGDETMLTLFPQKDGCDGFFIAAFEKRGER